MIWKYVWVALLRKRYHSVSLILFLNLLADLVTCFISKIPSWKKSSLVYLYRCSNWKVTYHENSFQNFVTRLSEHVITSNLTVKLIKKLKRSTIFFHLLQYDSPLTFDDFDILQSDSNKFKICVKESLLIKRDKPVLNRATKSSLLDLFD